jgi:hypothetical protein
MLASFRVLIFLCHATPQIWAQITATLSFIRTDIAHRHDILIRVGACVDGELQFARACHFSLFCFPLRTELDIAPCTLEVNIYGRIPLYDVQR